MVLKQPEISEIEPHLFIGNVSSSLDPDIIRDNGITAIVSLLDVTYSRRHDPEVQKLVPEKDQLFVPCEDSSTMDLLAPMSDICDFIESHLHPRDQEHNEAQTNGSSGKDPRIRSVLVHCDQGVSRSPTVVIAYLMRKHRERWDDVMGKVEKRRRISPSDNFINQLRAWQDVGYAIWEDEEKTIPKRPYDAYLEGRDRRLKGTRLTNQEALEFINS